MYWLKNQIKQGIFGTGWANAGVGLLLTIFLVLTSRIYSLLNHGPNVLFLKSSIDNIIPVIKIFIIPYVSLEPFIYMTLIIFLFFRTRIFQSAALSIITVWLISYAFYYFLQSYVARPQLTGNDFLTKMILMVYSNDNPYNDFPSLHTSLSTILAIHWYRVDKRIGIPVVIWVILIVLSTVFVKQHYIADVISGLALAFLVSFIFLRFVPSKTH